jgi:hypothetical protein
VLVNQVLTRQRRKVLPAAAAGDERLGGLASGDMGPERLTEHAWEQRELEALERSGEAFFGDVRQQETAPADLWARVATRMSEGGVAAEAQRRRIGCGGVRRLLWAAAIAATSRSSRSS